MSDRPVFSIGTIEEAEEDKKFFGVMVGTVINLIDPMVLGRVQVQLKAVDSLDLFPFARVASPMAGIAHGFYFIPSVGDEVLVAFEHGDLNSPYIIGSVWNALAPPPLPSPLAQVRMIRTPVGNQILFTEVPPSISIMGPSLSSGLTHVEGTALTLNMGTNVITITSAGIALTCGTSAITITPESITIAAPMINLV